MTSIWIYETDQHLAERMAAGLQKEGFSARICDPACLPAEEETPRMAVLSAQLRWTDCRPLLEAFAVRACPILFLTDDRSMMAHLHALYAGPSEVMAEPFSMKTFVHRVRTMTAAPAAPCELSLNADEHSAQLDGRRVELTAQEYALLLALMENPDTPVSREQLLRTAWGYQSIGETRTVDVHVQRLRRKLGSRLIETVYKYGYRLCLA